MTDNEFEKFEQRALEFYLARCFETKIASFRRKKELRILSSLFRAAISSSYEKGQLSVYEKINTSKKSTARNRFWKDMDSRYEKAKER